MAKRWTNRNFSRADQGFTLIETLIVTVMVGIMGAIAAPGMLGFLARAKVDQGFAKAQAVLQLTQREAIKQSETCATLLPDNDSEGGIITSECTSTGSETLTDIKIKYNRANSKEVNFSFRGHTNSMRTIVFYSPKTQHKRCIVISTGIGMIRSGVYTKDDLGSISANHCATSS